MSEEKLSARYTLTVMIDWLAWGVGWGVGVGRGCGWMDGWMDGHGMDMDMAWTWMDERLCRGGQSSPGP